MQIERYTHQYIKKVCRGEIPLILRFQRELAMEVMRRYAFTDIKTRVVFAYKIAPNIKCVLLPKNDVYVGKHCISTQKHPFIYFFIDEIAVGIELEKLMETELRFEGCGRWFTKMVCNYFCEHLEWLCKQDGNKASKFPYFRNALHSVRAKKDVYNVINEIFTYILKHNG